MTVIVIGRWHYSCYDMASALSLFFNEVEELLVEEQGFIVRASLSDMAAGLTTSAVLDIDEFSISSTPRRVSQV